MQALKEYVKTIDEVISGYPISTKTKCTPRHNMATVYIHRCLWKWHNFKDSQPYYEYKPPSLVCDNQKATILWNYSINADKKIDQVSLKTRKRSTAISLTCLSDNDVAKKMSEKLYKYKTFEMDIPQNMKTTIISLVVGLLSKNMKRYLSEMSCEITQTNNCTIWYSWYFEKIFINWNN